MPKIQDVGIGNYIMDNRGTTSSGRVKIGKVLKIVANNGNSFRCHPVTGTASGVDTLDMKNYRDIPIDTNVNQVTVRPA